ncbi:activating signal cointegrator 1 complex subunit 2 homolog [Drosophila suzukii]|uniref:Activating signal cointegrator 1 complex subunit 2 homolog n=1 Tax=Drosophila suzukii TaxID=28584 RepID=A0AB39ZXB3_DROSZ
MKVFTTILFLGLCLSGIRAEEELESIDDLLKDNAKGVKTANALLTRIAAVSEETQAGLAEQKEALKALTLIEELLAKLTLTLEASSQNLVATLLNISKQGEEYGHRTEAELLELARLQEGTKELINVLEAKLDAYQRHVLHSSRNIDKSIDGLAKLITRTVLPQLNGLKCTFDSLETSQINVEVELKSLAGVKELNENSYHKLDVLENQLKQLNRTQEQRLDTLITAVKHLQPHSSRKVEAALRELIISQKRIEVDLEECSRHQPYPGYQDESYLPTYGGEVPEPQYSQPKPKQVDLEQVWSIKEPPKQGEYSGSYRVTAYAQSPEPRENQQSSSAVSWRPSLPWENAFPYQSAPVHQPWNPAPAHGTTSQPKRNPGPKEEHSAPAPPPHQSANPEANKPPVEHKPKSNQEQSQKPQTNPEQLQKPQPNPEQSQKPQPNHGQPQSSHKPQSHQEQARKPQSYQHQSYKPELIHPGESFRIWYGDLPEGY